MQLQNTSTFPEQPVPTEESAIAQHGVYGPSKNEFGLQSQLFDHRVFHDIAMMSGKVPFFDSEHEQACSIDGDISRGTSFQIDSSCAFSSHQFPQSQAFSTTTFNTLLCTL